MTLAAVLRSLCAEYYYRDLGMSEATINAGQTIIDALESSAARYGARPFIIDGDIEVSFAELLTRVEAVATGLLLEGFTSGDRGAIWSPNSADWIIAALAIQRVGGTLVTLNTRYKAGEAAAILRASGTRVVFAIESFLDTAYISALIQEDLGSTEMIVALGSRDALYVETSSSIDIRRLESLEHRGTEAALEADWKARLNACRAMVRHDTPSDILFTSGTTGTPKGVVTHHGQNVKAFKHFADILGIDESDRYLIINPFFHSFGYKAGWLAALLNGATVYPMAVFDVPSVLACIEHHGITVMPGPPTLFQSILNHPTIDFAKLRSLKKATTGAATIPTQLIVDMQKVLGIDTVLTAYGLSESTGLATICRTGDNAETIASTSGRAIPEIEVAIMNSQQQLLGTGEVGEIVIRGFNVMQEYLDNPLATAETIDAQGWLHTGDVGYLDAEGNLSITDRLKDMYICGGFNCYPAEIENQLLAHPGIAQVAVTGAPDDRLGEVGAAFFVAAHNWEPDIDELKQWSREHIANYKVPRYFVPLESLPLNASGKVLKTELRQYLNRLRAE